MGVDLNGQLGSGSRTNPINGAVAQLVEQRTENPCVAGSIPARTTKQVLWSTARRLANDNL